MTKIQLAALSRQIDVYESCYDHYDACGNYRGKKQYLIAKKPQTTTTDYAILNDMLAHVPDALISDFFVYKYMEYDSRKVFINKEHPLAVRMIKLWPERENVIRPILQKIIEREVFCLKELEDELRDVLYR